MKEKERKILQSLGSLFMVAISFLGGRELQGSESESTALAHFEEPEPVFTPTPQWTVEKTAEHTPLPTYTPQKNYTQKADRPTAQVIATRRTPTATEERTSTTVSLVDIKKMTATQIITNATSIASNTEDE